MTPQQLIERLIEQRREWVDISEPLGLPPMSRQIRCLRPAEAQMHQLRSATMLDLVQSYVDGWQGFTEASLIGPDGSSAAVPFDADLWRAWVVDQSEVIALVVQRLGDMVQRHLKTREQASGN